jgi:hypothetical protein
MAIPLEDSLRLFGYLSLEEVNEKSLKQNFRRIVRATHPDHGGDGAMFDQALSGFVYLSGVLRRGKGGRDRSQVLHPTDIQQAREAQYAQEMSLIVNDVLDSIRCEQESDFIRIFNHQFEAHRATEEGRGFSASEARGYVDWLSSDEKSTVSFASDGVYGSCTMKPPVIQEADLHRMFEYTAKCGKPPVTALMLHPDQMALRVASGGTALIASTTDSFTSDLLERPEYCDLQAAYTKENTLVDKLPEFVETGRTFESVLKEREMVYVSELDRDLAAIAEYEKAKQAEEAAHKQRIQGFFQSTGSSQWALRGMRQEEEEKQEAERLKAGDEKEEAGEKKDDFVKTIGGKKNTPTVE